MRRGRPGPDRYRGHMDAMERVRKYVEAGALLGEVARARTGELTRELGRSAEAVGGHVSDVLRRSADLGRGTTGLLANWVTPWRAPEPAGKPPEKAVC